MSRQTFSSMIGCLIPRYFSSLLVGDIKTSDGSAITNLLVIGEMAILPCSSHVQVSKQFRKSILIENKVSNYQDKSFAFF